MMHHPALTICAVLFTYLAYTPPYGASETTSHTHLGIKCVEKCEANMGQYECQMKTEKRKSLTVHCPAENSHEYTHDPEKTSLYCEIDDNYYLCQVDNSLENSENENVENLQPGTPHVIKASEHHHWLKRQANDEETVMKIDKRECIKLIFKEDVDHKAIADGNCLEEEILEIIAKWNNGYLRNKAKSNLIKTDNLRIDLQEVFSRGHLRYYNLQIQINCHRKKGKSTTVSQVLTPEVPAAYVRSAFTESFRKRAKVTLEVKRIEECKNKK